MTVEDEKKTHKKLLKFVCTVEYIINKRLCEIKANKYSQSSRRFSKPDCILSESIDIPHIQNECSVFLCCGSVKCYLKYGLKALANNFEIFSSLVKLSQL